MTARYAGLDFEGFKSLATDPARSPHEKVGFPDSYREGKAKDILRDVAAKLPALRARGKSVLDIGAGCSDVATSLIELCGARGHRLTLVDSAEMLAQLPQPAHVEKVAGRFPDDCLPFVEQHRGGFDAVLVYSVLHYVFVERAVFSFLDRAMELLAPGGALLIGDIPNQSMRKRFFASAAGARFHQSFTDSPQPPLVEHGVLETGFLDDAVLLGLLMRARAAGFHGFLVPQDPRLPMANRREDLLVVRP
ncbi:MAG TPA: class I SAM-dependent methyltransferase [Thermoanaerobaculia bacterium]|jgi:2-polyprenyl-3-methyl-5-hydroxy-6-metoxy-1,4-benzoquinol methylase|nr:class I SAM-dependent methyltransferase [Thermoanaerobaculia bacterium]